MSAIIFIRHAETDLAGTLCGHSDPELNARGYAQLPALIDELRGQDIGVVYTSDLRRARTTAAAIAYAFAVHCHACSSLREIDFGAWEGLSWTEVERRDPAYASRWLAEYPNLPAPGGEAFSAFEERILHSVHALCKLDIPRNIAVVCHAGVLRTILCRLQGQSASDAWQQTRSYCSIVRHSRDDAAPASTGEVAVRACR